MCGPEKNEKKTEKLFVYTKVIAFALPLKASLSERVRITTPWQMDPILYFEDEKCLHKVGSWQRRLLPTSWAAGKKLLDTHQPDVKHVFEKNMFKKCKKKTLCFVCFLLHRPCYVMFKNQ